MKSPTNLKPGQRLDMDEILEKFKKVWKPTQSDRVMSLNC